MCSFDFSIINNWKKKNQNIFLQSRQISLLGSSICRQKYEGSFFKNLLAYLVCSQIWLNASVLTEDDRHLSYMTKTTRQWEKGGKKIWNKEAEISQKMKGFFFRTVRLS